MAPTPKIGHSLGKLDRIRDLVVRQAIDRARSITPRTRKLDHASWSSWSGCLDGTHPSSPRVASVPATRPRPIAANHVPSLDEADDALDDVLDRVGHYVDRPSLHVHEAVRDILGLRPEGLGRFAQTDRIRPGDVFNRVVEREQVGDVVAPVRHVSDELALLRQA